MANLHGNVDIDADSVAETNNENNQQDPPQVKAVVFYADADTRIANRLQGKLLDFGYNVELGQFHVAGDHHMDVISNYMENSNMYFWLVTPTSLQDDRMMKFIRYVVQYKCVQEPGCRFIPLVPEEHLSLQKPAILSTYIPLCENNGFEKSARATLASFLKEAKKGMKNPTLASASTSAIADQDNSVLRHIQATSDTGTAGAINEPPQHVSQENDELDLTAERESQIQPISNNGTWEDVVREQEVRDQPLLQADGQGNVDQAPAVDTSVFHIHIHGSNANVQIGSGNTQIVSLQKDATSG